MVARRCLAAAAADVAAAVRRCYGLLLLLLLLGGRRLLPRCCYCCRASCVAACCCRLPGCRCCCCRGAESPGAAVLLLLLKPVLSLLVGADWLQPRLAAVRPSPLRACAGCSTPISVLAGRRVGWDADCGPVEPARISRVAGCCGSVGRDRGQRQQSTTSIAVRHPASSGMNHRLEPVLHTGSAPTPAIGHT